MALEFAFLSFEAKGDPIPAQALARRVFDSLRRAGNATAEQAFQNIDRPLQLGIERWTKALEIGPESFSARYELAQLAERRDELPLAAANYLRAWQILPARKAVLLDLARVRTALKQPEEAMARSSLHHGAESRARPNAPANFCLAAIPMCTNFARLWS